MAAQQSGLRTQLVHSTLTAFPDWPLWHEIAGGGWTYGSTYHPDYGPGVALAHPDHPLAWTRVWGTSPIVADAPDMTPPPYRAARRAALLHRELNWLGTRKNRAPSR